MPEDLNDRLLAAISIREEAAFRQTTRDQQMLRRHRQLADHPDQICSWCRDYRWPCADIRDLAFALDVNLD